VLQCHVSRVTCSVLQEGFHLYVAVCCGVSQCDAVMCCSVLRCVAVYHLDGVLRCITWTVVCLSVCVFVCLCVCVCGGGGGGGGGGGVGFGEKFTY